MHKRKYIFICGTAKGTPIWMYYVKYLLVLLESFINLFLIPFHTQLDISLHWMAHMLRHGSKQWKQAREKFRQEALEHRDYTR